LIDEDQVDRIEEDQLAEEGVQEFQPVIFNLRIQCDRQ
jgi:hypothetical protein